jgi:hypothetical protein
MAFTIRDLSVLAYANGFTLWHYKNGREPLDVTDADGFFSDASDMMAPGDMVMISGGHGARVVCVARSGDGAVVTAPLG